MRILIIEDDYRIARIVKSGLEREGYAVDHVADGEDGQRRIELHHKIYNLIILDLMLPGRSGLDICKEVRSLKITIPILILTARGGVEDKATLLNAGADDYLVKPFSFQELLARIRAIVRRPKDMLPSKLTLGDLTLDPVSKKVYLKGKEIELTLKEFTLLEYFMRHPNQAINREQLVDDLFDFDFDSFSNVIDVHINNLRKKISQNDKEKFIETVRGVGYRIKSEA